MKKKNEIQNNYETNTKNSPQFLNQTESYFDSILESDFYYRDDAQLQTEFLTPNYKSKYKSRRCRLMGWPEFGRQTFQSINFSIDFPLIDLDLKRFGQLSIETSEYVISSPGFDFGYLLLHFSTGTPL